VTSTPPADNGAGSPADSDAPVAGVTSRVITAATRRVARRWRDEAESGGPDSETIAGLLAALALAADQRHPGFVTDLQPRPSPSLGHRLADMLCTELVRGWTESPGETPPAVMLATLSALEHVRNALEAKRAQQPPQPSLPDGLDLLVEIGHDLRSPLTSIMFLAETLQRGTSGVVNDVQYRQLGLVYSAALGLSALVSDALEFARGGDELSDTDLTPFSVAGLLLSVQDMVRPIAEEKGLEIIVEPPHVDDRLGYPTALSRALLNLTTNALKFTERGSVTVSCDPRAQWRMEFSVRDTGPGINPEALTSLFQPFRRARGRPGYCFSGTGLGLAITRKLVRAMGGELRFETEPGRGTRFFFEIDLPSAAL
jgi:signal transduction histidine kinase